MIVDKKLLLKSTLLLIFIPYLIVQLVYLTTNLLFPPSVPEYFFLSVVTAPKWVFEISLLTTMVLVVLLTVFYIRNGKSHGETLLSLIIACFASSVWGYLDVLSSVDTSFFLLPSLLDFLWALLSRTFKTSSIALVIVGVDKYIYKIKGK